MLRKLTWKVLCGLGLAAAGLAPLASPTPAAADDISAAVITPAVIQTTGTQSPDSSVQQVAWRRGWGPGVGVYGGWRRPGVGVYVGPGYYGRPYYRPYYRPHYRPYAYGYGYPGYGYSYSYPTYGYSYGYAPYNYGYGW